MMKLPATMNLGPASLSLAAPERNLAGSSYTHVLQVQEFRRPEFEVKAQPSEGPYVVGDHATVTVSATYYAGGALPGAKGDAYSVKPPRKRKTMAASRPTGPRPATRQRRP